MKMQIIIRIRQLYNKFVVIKKRIKLKQKLKRSNKKILKFKNLHYGERCFIIGNGPSLRIDDLEKIKDEYSFASHRIYKLFDQTQWHPTYYCAQDLRLIDSSHDEIDAMQISNKFIAYCQERELDYFDNAIFVRLLIEDFYPNLPNFSQNPIKGIYEGFTVTYMCLQLAFYMGFSEIYLLGMDHQYSIERFVDGQIVINNGIQDHFDANDKVTNYPQPEKSTLSYQAAKKNCDMNNIKIFNATRGGKLEVFPRINFDTLFTKDD